MTSARQEARHLAMLRRRRDRLAERLAEWNGQSTSYTRAEMLALNWAIRLLEERQ